MPVYDLIAIGAGIWAALFGSPVLHELFDEPVIDTMGTLLAIVATTCLLGVAFPHLWRWEICGKALLVALLAAYAAAVVLFRANPAASAGFVAFIIVLALPLPIFRLTLLGEEIKERREEDA
ncbi:hypothetical protein [Microbacterium oxydans]|uniref:hypothetical protein n=1 Tax=Microbacterium oxydans TaxID=82380 RepID=UPI0014796AC8|nr:hypothetical protein [Microbacterium oxydans]